jgi:hypothetical protein
MEEHLYALLSGAVSFPVSWGTMGEGTGTPRATIYRTGATQDHTMAGPGTISGTVQVDCYGQTFAEAIGASRDIRTALAGYRGGPIQGAFLQSIRDGFEDDAQLLQRVSMTFSVHYRE